MNGIHDIGGMHGHGPIEIEANEPVFHHPWEARVFALTRAVGAFRKWNIDASRHQRELIPAAAYLSMSYYERWFAGMLGLMSAHGLATREEIETGKPSPESPRQAPALSPEQVSSLIGRGVSSRRDAPIAPRFQPGARVRARNLNPTGHTRLPRYARGHAGIIDRDHGVHVFPDTNAHFRGEKPQHVYSVCFTARELWGDDASPHDLVYVDLWEDYLDPA